MKKEEEIEVEEGSKAEEAEEEGLGNEDLRSSPELDEIIPYPEEHCWLNNESPFLNSRKEFMGGALFPEEDSQNWPALQ